MKTLESRTKEGERTQMQRPPANLITTVTSDPNTPQLSCLEYFGHSSVSTRTLGGLGGAKIQPDPHEERKAKGNSDRQGQSLWRRGPKFRGTSFLAPVLSNGTLISRKVIQGRISRRTKNSSGAPDL